MHTGCDWTSCEPSSLQAPIDAWQRAHGWGAGRPRATPPRCSASPRQPGPSRAPAGPPRRLTDMWLRTGSCAMAAPNNMPPETASDTAADHAQLLTVPRRSAPIVGCLAEGQAPGAAGRARLGHAHGGVPVGDAERGVGQRDRAALRLVAREQRRPGRALQHCTRGAHSRAARATGAQRMCGSATWCGSRSRRLTCSRGVRSETCHGTGNGDGVPYCAQTRSKGCVSNRGSALAQLLPAGDSLIASRLYAELPPCAAPCSDGHIAPPRPEQARHARRAGAAARRACRQLPGQVVRVLDARVHAEAAGRREAVRRVPGQEHAAVLPARARHGVSSGCRPVCPPCYSAIPTYFSRLIVGRHERVRPHAKRAERMM